jgi:hypothetical protein
MSLFPSHLHRLRCQTDEGRKEQQKQRDDWEKEKERRKVRL